MGWFEAGTGDVIFASGLDMLGYYSLNAHYTPPAVNKPWHKPVGVAGITSIILLSRLLSARYNAVFALLFVWGGKIY